MNARSRAWTGFGGIALVVVLALGALTWAALKLEQAELGSRETTRRIERTRHALWRIDSWMGAWISAETARSTERYLEVSEPPVFRPLVAARFELRDGGWRGRSDGEPFPPPWLDADLLRSAIGSAEERLGQHLSGASDPSFDERVATCVVPGDDPAAGGPVTGPVLPVFVEAPAPELGELLLLARRSVTDQGEALQGIAVNWARLRERLIELPEPGPGRFRFETLDSCGDATDRLATLPVRLHYHAGPAPRAAGWTPARGAIGLAWLVALAALATLGIGLRRALDLAERRERFAVTVTHELRTPLTTLRMYADMLAGGMIREPERRDEYLATLRAEADRLGALVENVLAYARLERSGPQRGPGPVAVTDLLETLVPALRSQAEQAGMQLTVHGDGSVSGNVRTDIETLAQVLRNLVDNAGKYAAGLDRRLRLAVEPRAGFVGLRLSDGGPGIPAQDRERIFSAYERGETAPAATPGIGLGLGLSRGLIRELGGDLVLEPSATGGGAVFRIDLPVDETPSG